MDAKERKKIRMNKYIVVEGVDYSGKSTVLRYLQQALTERDIDSIITAHPGSTQLGKALRQIIKDPTINVDKQTRSILLAADNMEFQASIAKPLMSSQTWLLADRSNFISSFAYQIADGISMEDVKKCHDVVLNPRKIDHCFIFDIDFDTMAQRKSQRGAELDYYERDKKHFEKLRTAYSRIMDNKHHLTDFIDHDDDYIPNIHFMNGADPTEKSVEKILRTLDLLF